MATKTNEQEDIAGPPTRLAGAVGLGVAALVMTLSLAAFVVGAGGQAGPVRGVDVGHMALDFSLRDAADGRVSLADFAGRPLVLVFAADDADLNNLPDLGDAARVVAVCDAAPAARVEGLDMLVDAGDLVAERYSVTRRPEAVVISDEGVILDRGPVAATLARLDRTLAKAKAVAGR